MNEQIGSISRKMKKLKYNQMRILELKNKKPLDWHNSKLDRVEGSVNLKVDTQESPNQKNRVKKDSK